MHLYDLSETLAHVNSVALDMLGLGGVLHVGVDIFGREWSFGLNGVSVSVPRRHEFYAFRQTVPMGKTQLLRREAERTVSHMRPDWPGTKYDLLTNNCGSFCNELCIRLGVGPLPSWVMRPAEALAQLPAARALASRLARATSADMDPYWRLETEKSTTRALASPRSHETTPERPAAGGSGRSSGGAGQVTPPGAGAAPPRSPPKPPPRALESSPVVVRFTSSPGPRRLLPTRRCEAFRVDACQELLEDDLCEAWPSRDVFVATASGGG